MNSKQIVGEKAVEYIKEDMIVGLGTGSTAYWTIRKLGELVSEGFKIKAVPTSVETEMLARKWKIPLLEPQEAKHLDLTIDGADEFDDNMQLIKGGGGALLREKIIASMTEFYIVVADGKKQSDLLHRYPLPVEVTPFAYQITMEQIRKLGAVVELRRDLSEIFVTDNKNYIVDCDFGRITQASDLERELNLLPGVVENGLFVDRANVIVTENEGSIEIVSQKTLRK